MWRKKIQKNVNKLLALPETIGYSYTINNAPENEMTKANTQQAKTLGSIAFARGINAPALDSAMMEMISGRQVGDSRTMKEMRAWVAGWTQANLSAS